MALEHYNSDRYGVVAQTDKYLLILDELVWKLQGAVANFAMYHHFIWLQIRISNNGITIPESDSEKAAYRYQTDEAKEEFVKAAWASINNAIAFLNENATKWTVWGTETAYAEMDIVQQQGLYYVCTEAHTSGVFADDYANLKWSVCVSYLQYWVPEKLYFLGETVRNEGKWYECVSEHISASNFATDEAVWSEITPVFVNLIEWTQSEQYTACVDFIFAGERDFSKYYNIENSAYFYMKIVFIIEECIADDIETRISSFGALKERFAQGKQTDADKILMRKIKKAVAYRTMSEAVSRFSVHELPAPVRAEILEAENTRRRNARGSNQNTLRATVGAPIAHRAEKFLLDLDIYMDTIAQAEANTVEAQGYETWKDEAEDLEDDKFVSI
jgi:hypothetical protein